MESLPVAVAAAAAAGVGVGVAVAVAVAAAAAAAVAVAATHILAAKSLANYPSHPHRLLQLCRPRHLQCQLLLRPLPLRRSTS